MLQPDSIIPDLYDSQSWDRYSYVRNNPVNRVDPSGHTDRAPEESCGLRTCILTFHQDLLASKVFKGSNPDGSWNWDDKYFYSRNRLAIWSDPSTWHNPDPKGWEGFASRVERLASHYTEKEKTAFLRDFALIFGGIPDDTNFALAAWSVKHGPQEVSPLEESNIGLRSDLLDTLTPTMNQSHHYVGLFFLGYYVEPGYALVVNMNRDPDNPGDILLGDIGIYDGSYFQQKGTYAELVARIRALKGN